MDDELQINLSSEAAAIMHFKPIVTYLEHIENGLMVVSSKGCAKLQTYLFSEAINKDLEPIEETKESSL